MKTGNRMSKQDEIGFDVETAQPSVEPVPVDTLSAAAVPAAYDETPNIPASEPTEGFDRWLHAQIGRHTAAVSPAALPLASRIELTEIDADVPGDTFLPPLGQGWRETFRESHEPSGEKPAFAFVTLARAL